MNYPNILAADSSPLVGKNEHHIRKKIDWVHKLRKLRLSHDEELVSFDVTSLFTSIPGRLAVKVAKSRLDNDDNLMAEHHLHLKT